MRRLPALVWLLVAASLLTASCRTATPRPTLGPASGPTTSTSTPAPRPPPPEGQADVTGTVARVEADAQIAPAIATPFRATVPAAGAGSATIGDAIVEGRRQTIAWTGGRPLVVSGAGGALRIGRVRVVIDADAATWHLDGDVHAFRPGTYRIDTPVAVGASGLSTPRDAVTFTADGTTTFVTHGDVAVGRPVRAVRLEGPGAVRLVGGDLRVRTHTGARQVAGVRHQGGPYVIEVLPAAGGGLDVVATLRGDLVFDPHSP